MKAKTDSMSYEAPEISILVTTYNRRSPLERNLNSIFRQTFKNYEIIVIDDCSQDDTEAFIKSLKDPRVRYYRNEVNRGRQFGDWWAVHKCIYEYMRGNYFIYLCDDDYWHPEDLLEKLLEKHHKYPNLSLACGMHAHVYPTKQDAPSLQSVPGIENCYTSKGVFPSGHMKGLDFLDIFSSSPCIKNFLDGAILFSREKMMVCGAFKVIPKKENWQGGYMLKMGLACVGDVYFIDEPCVVSSALTDTFPTQSFRRTHRDHYYDGLEAILNSYLYLRESNSYKLMERSKKVAIKKLYKRVLLNYLEHWLISQKTWISGHDILATPNSYFSELIRLGDVVHTLKYCISSITLKKLRKIFSLSLQTQIYLLERL